MISCCCCVIVIIIVVHFCCCKCFRWSCLDLHTKKKLFWCVFFYSVCFYLFSYNPIRMALWNNVTNFAARLYLCVWEMVRTHRAIFTFTCQRHTLLLTDLGFAIKNHAKNRAHCFILFSVFIRWCTRKRDACALFQLAKWAFSKGFFCVSLVCIIFLWIEYNTIFDFGMRCTFWIQSNDTHEL